MVFGCDGVAPGDDTQGSVLHRLEISPLRVANTGGPYWGRVVDERPTYGLVGRQNSFLILAPSTACESSEDFVALFHFLSHIAHMF